MDIIKAIEHEQLKSSIPDLKIGNTVRVHVKIKEGNKERIQVFEGIIIKVQGEGVNKSFTVRKISYGVGVEKTFLIHSPLVEKVEVVRVGKARRAKLFYLRDRIGKAAKTKEKLGARIENKEIVIKGSEIEVPVEGEAETEEVTPVVEETTTVETPVTETTEVPETVKTEEVPVEEVKEEVKVEEKVVEEAKVEETAAEEVKTEETTETSETSEDKKDDTTTEE